MVPQPAVVSVLAPPMIAPLTLRFVPESVTVHVYVFFCSSRRRHTRCGRDWSSDVCSSDLTLVYLLIKERKPRALIKEVANNMEGQRNEMSIFASSAAMGGILASLVPTELIDPELLTPQWEMLIATVGLLLLPLGAAIGIAPIAVMSFLAGVLAQLQILGLSPLTTGVALSIGFSLAMMLSPFGPSVMILSRMGRVSKYIVAFNWNGLFTLASLPLMLALLAVLVW